jgi:hypothetical protein
MFSFIWDVYLSMSMSMFIGGLAGVDFCCADTIGADRARAMIPDMSIGVFILVFLIGLNKFTFPLLAGVGDQGLP